MVDIFSEIKNSAGKAAQLCDRKMGVYCLFWAKYGQLGLEGTKKPPPKGFSALEMVVFQWNKLGEADKTNMAHACPREVVEPCLH